MRKSKKKKKGYLKIVYNKLDSLLALKKLKISSVLHGLSKRFFDV